MFKISLEDFKEEIKAEMYGYEEIEESLIEKWFNVFNEYIDEKKDKKNRISYKANSVTINLKDESDIFKIVDNFFAAVENEELENYWSSFQI
jgi:hypothetical protein